jgi:hypothetical protein
MKSLALVIPLLLFPFMSARAATFCVHDGVELQAALTASSTNNQDDSIRLAPGAYEPVADAFIFSSAEPHGLAILGGYDTPPNSSPCGVALQGAGWSGLIGGGTKRLLDISMSSTSAAPVTLRHLALTGGFSSTAKAPISVSGVPGWSGDVIVENISVHNNHVDLIVAQFITNGRIFVLSSEFFGNASDGPLGTIVRLVTHRTGSGPNILFNNNSVAGNSVPASSNRAGLSFSTDGPGEIRIANNILWNNGGADISMSSAGPVLLDNNDIGVRAVGSGVVVIENAAFNVDPQFAAIDDLRLLPNSPLRDAGLTAPVGGVGSTDVLGETRTVFSAIDVGAHEVQDLIFRHGFEFN